MLVKERRRVGLLIVAVFATFFVFWGYTDREQLSNQPVGEWLGFPKHSDDGKTQQLLLGSKGQRPKPRPWSDFSSSLSYLTSPVDKNTESADGKHHAVFSLSRKDEKFFPIRFGEKPAINPNIIPHPTRADAFIIVAQRFKRDVLYKEHVELVCTAVMNATDANVNGTTGPELELTCAHDSPPAVLPIKPTTGDKCTGEYEWIQMNVGPHDARVFYGPEAPYAVYGSNSNQACFGQWIQDMRALMPDTFGGKPDTQSDHGIGGKDPLFPAGTDMQRPAPWGPIEKNWFVFWDADGKVYGHYDMHPRRSFASLALDGTAGPELASHAAANDDKCMAKYMPAHVDETAKAHKQRVHQATNSLSVTLCRRGACEPNDDNTFIFTIFHAKISSNNFLTMYEPYVMVFRRSAPFEVFGISKTPVWINGRELTVNGFSTMFFLTSMNWKDKENKYHGYLDDTLMLGFGINDAWTGGIDVPASEVLRDLGLCSDV